MIKNLKIISDLLSLNLKKYKIVDYEKIPIKETSVFHIQSNQKKVICPHCGIKTDKKQDLRLYKQKKNLKHINISNQLLVEIKPIKRYFRCNKCNKSFLEQFDFESPHGFHTKLFEHYVISSFGYTSGNQIAKLNKVSASKIYNIITNIDYLDLNKTGLEILEKLDEIYLGVDEHSFSGHDMVLIITELKTKQLIAVLPKITKKSLEDWIDSIPLKIQTKIKGFSTDMNKGYKNSLKTIISNPVHSVDKYHLFQEANKVVDEVRQLNSWLIKMNFIKADEIINLGKIPKKFTKQDIKKINKNSKNSETIEKYKNKALQKLKTEDIDPNNCGFKNKKGEYIKYKEITLNYFLETGYRNLFLKREKNLSETQKLRINQIFREYDYNGYLAESWANKEDFMDAIDNLNIKEVDKIIDGCKKSEHFRIRQFGRTLTNWYDGIKGFCEHSTESFKFTNALTEGFNNKCKVAKRQSYGFKLKENYIRKIFAGNMLDKGKKGFMMRMENS